MQKKQSLDAELARLAKPYARRIEARRWLKRFGLVCCAATGLGLLLMLLSFLMPIEYALGKALLAAAIAILLDGVLMLFFRLSPQSMAEAIDESGFRERLQTALALASEDNAFARLQREDTAEALRRGSPKERVPIEAPIRPLALAAGGLLLCCALALLPNPHAQELAEREEARRVMAEQAERIEASLEALSKDDSLTAEQRSALNEKLRQLAGKLRRKTDYREGMRELSRAQNELTKLERERADQNAENLQEALAQQPQTEDLAKELAGKSPQEARDALEKAVEDALAKKEEGQAGENIADTLAQALAQAAEAAGGTPLADALESLSKSLEEGDGQGAEQALDDLQDALDANTGSSVLQQLSGDLKLSKSRMSQLSQNAGNASSAQNPAQSSSESSGGQDGNQSSSHSGGDASGNANGGASNNPGGNGTGNGSPGEASGGSGQGAGSGSGSGSGSAAGSGQGAGSGSGALVESETFYDDRRLPGNGENLNIEGDLNTDGPRSQAETTPGEGSLDGYLPYKQVVEDYAESAVTAAKRQQLPPAVQGWVTEYFDALRE